MKSHIRLKMTLLYAEHNGSRGVLTSKRRPAIPLGSSSSSGAHQQTDAAALRTSWLRRWSSLHDNGRAQMLQLADNFGQEKENFGFKTRNPVMNHVEGWMAAALWGRWRNLVETAYLYQNNCLMQRAREPGWTTWDLCTLNKTDDGRFR